jgi:5-methylcytosine-specific restriction endonuclease McrA
MCGFATCDSDAWAKGYCQKHYYTAQRHGLLPRPECSVEGCSKPSFRAGMCNAHHLRTKRYGNPHMRKKVANGEAKNSVCSVSGCPEGVVARGLCSVHYGRKRHHGDPLATPTKLGNGQATDERKKENRIRALKTYAKTPHGKLRRRYSNAKRRVLAGLESSGIPKDAFLELWATPTCAICQKPVADMDKSIDHKVPLSRGGTNDIDNMQIAHLRCNQIKGDRLLQTGD